MHRGYVKKWRKIVDSKFFSMGLKHIGLFDYLLIKANWKTGWFMGHEIKPGQFGTSITKLSDAVGEHRHTIKKILQDLSDCSMIKRQNMSNRWVLITVCNWETYQGNGTDDNPTKLQPNSNRTPTACQPTATIKEGKALRTGKDNTPPTPKGEGYTQEFEAVWKLYPNKEKKGTAFRAFKKAKKKVPVQKIVDAIEKQKTTHKWCKDGGKYIAMFSSWLNGDEWNNDIESMNRGKTTTNRQHERKQFSFPEGEEINNEM